MRSSRSKAFAGLLVIGALVAGCGGGDELSDEEYQDEVQAALAPLEELQQITPETPPDASPEEAAQAAGEQFEQLDSALQTSTDDLEAIEPPSDFEEPHGRLVEAFSSFQAATAEAQGAAEEGDTEALSGYFTSLTEFQQELTEVGQEFEDAGLEIDEQPTE